MKFEKKCAENTPVQTNPGGDDRISSLFQPDVLLAEQYIQNFRRKTPLEPEKALLLAVLEDGVRCFQDNIVPRNKKSRCCSKRLKHGFLAMNRMRFLVRFDLRLTGF